MKMIGRHLKYANVVATLALVFAMGGTAVAAKHFLISSTSQINPKVLKKLKGNTGKTGAKGTSGTNGTNGTNGATGATGAEGAKGTAGLSALAPLPSGQTESGEYGFGLAGGVSGEFVSNAVSFPIPLLEGAPPSHVIFTTTSVPVAHCAGPGKAEQGYVCIYSFNAIGVTFPPVATFGVDGGTEVTPGTGRFGFIMEWKTTAGHPFAWGTYSVNAG
jgi:hypothetical protein